MTTENTTPSVSPVPRGGATAGGVSVTDVDGVEIGASVGQRSDGRYVVAVSINESREAVNLTAADARTLAGELNQLADRAQADCHHMEWESTTRFTADGYDWMERQRCSCGFVGEWVGGHQAGIIEYLGRESMEHYRTAGGRWDDTLRDWVFDRPDRTGATGSVS